MVQCNKVTANTPPTKQHNKTLNVPDNIIAVNSNMLKFSDFVGNS